MFATATAFACSDVCFPICPIAHVVTASKWLSSSLCNMVDRWTIACNECILLKYNKKGK